jgi:type VI secretion system protein ImpF
MATAPKNRLSPPLMHAFRAAHAARDAQVKLDLRDPAGGRIIASRRTSRRAAITEPHLKREVACDLEALMNAIALESTVDLTPYESARGSILNHGLPDFARQSLLERSVEDIKGEIKTALTRYEPRLVPDTILVTKGSELTDGELTVRFLVRADLICEPLNVPVEFIADLELNTGSILVERS